MPTYLLLILLSIYSTTLSIAQTRNKRTQDIEGALPVIDNLFKAFADSTHLPSLIYGLVVDGKLIHTFNTGYSNLNKKIAVTPQTCFRIASMTKSFTAMAILKLRDEGKLKLDDPAYLYVPEMKQQPYLTKDALPVTIRHLLTHTAGFPEDNPWGDRQLSMSDQTLINMIKKGISFSNDPGVDFEYSNLGYAILGYIIKKVSGQSKIYNVYYFTPIRHAAHLLAV
jgi:CubicO group peptidase (beta-lactamase class C family)